ncbi:MAG: lipoprotein signal peptidase [Oxalobacter sp.]|nr:lipoprotein signal peptidase [Oxalobacter sp.]
MARMVFSQKRNISIIWWLVVAALVVVFDQLSKRWALGLMQLGDTIQVTSFFNLHLLYNEGSAFSFLASQSGWQRTLFIAIGIVAALFILYEIRKHRDNNIFCFALALILGGDIGNVIDRLAYGHVVDFLDFHLGTSHYPTFNIADCGVCIGAAIFVILEFRKKKS